MALVRKCECKDYEPMMLVKTNEPVDVVVVGEVCAFCGHKQGECAAHPVIEESEATA